MSDTLRELVPAAPPAAVGGLQWAGFDLPTIVLVTTLIYTIVQLLLALPKLYNLIKGWIDATRK